MTGDVAVIGMSAVFPQSPDLLSYWTNIVNGRDCITRLPEDRWLNHPSGETVDLGGIRAPAMGGFIDTEFEFDAFRYGVLPVAVKNAGPEQFIMLEVVARALDDARVADDDARRATTDLFVGQGGFGNAPQGRILHGTEIMPVLSGLLAEADRDVKAILMDSLPDMNPSEVETAVPNFTANATAKRLNLQGVAYTLDAACASSLVTVELGVDRLRNRRCDLAVAAGGHFAQNPTFWYIMASLGALSDQGQIRPFDKVASGLIPGEGAGAVVLKRLEDAVADGDEVYAVVKGTGTSSDGKGKGLFAPSAAGQKLALDRAYSDAGVSPDTIGLLEAHGTATPIGDAAEVETIRLVFGERTTEVPTRAMGTVKSMIGHTMPAAGIAGFIKATLALTHKVLPPSLNCTDPIDAFAKLPFYVNRDARPWVHPAFGPPRRAAVNAFGFGGVNGHVVLEEVPEPRRLAIGRLSDESPGEGSARPQARPRLSVTDRPTETLFFSAASPVELAAQLETAAGFADDVELEALAQTLAERVCSSDECRLAVSCESGEPITDRLSKLAAEIRDNGMPAKDLRVSGNSGLPATRETSLLFGGARLAFDLASSDFIFERALHVPATLEALNHLQPEKDEAHRPLPWDIELSAPTAFPAELRARLLNDLQAPRDGDLSDLMMWCAANRVRSIVQFAGWLAVKDLGLDIGSLLTVSLGEYLAVALCLDIDPKPMMDRLWEVGVDFKGIVGLGGGSLFVSASEEQLEPVMRDRPGVEIALHMAPTMLLLGGPYEALVEIAAEVTEKGWLNWLNEIPPVHTAMLTDASMQFGAALAEFETASESRFPIYSASVPGLLPDDPDEIVRLVGMSARRPAKIWQMLEIAAKDGVRHVIECGPGAHYSVFRSIEGATDVVAVATDDDVRHPITQLQRVVSDLFVAGATIDPSGVFQARPDKTFGLDTEAESGSVQERPKVSVSLAWAPIGLAAAAVGKQSAGPAKRNGQAPLLGELSRDSESTVSNTLTFDIDVDRYIQDHSLMPDDGRPGRDRFPVVPGSFIVEAMAETAAQLVTDMAVVEVSDIRYQRWFETDATGRVTVTFRATRSDAQTVTVDAVVDGRTHASASVHFGEVFRSPRQMSWPEPVNAHAFPGTAADIYQPGELFHGPLLQVVESITYRSDTIVEGCLRVTEAESLFGLDGEICMATDPVAIDASAHLIGAWVFGVDIAGFPTQIDSIALHGPRPAPGSVVPCKLEIVEFSIEDARLKANMEVGDGQGGQWFTVLGFVDWVFAEAPLVSQYRKTAAPGLLSNRLALAGLPADMIVTAAPNPKFNSVQLKLLELSFLRPEERDADLPRRQRLQLLGGRIAAKEALMFDPRNTAHVWEIDVRNLPGGAPAFEANGHWVPECLSLSHSDWGAVAATYDAPVGVDIESNDVTAAAGAFEFLDRREVELLESIFPGVDEARLLRAGWCAKEATAKAVGSGLEGRPNRWCLTGVDGEARLICLDQESEIEYVACVGEVEAATVAVAFRSPS